MSWSPDGRSLVYWVLDPKTRGDLWLLPLSGDRKAVPLLRTPFVESHGQISPDGRWLAYESDETGRREIYVQPFPAGAGKWQVSTNGGTVPRWRADGRELFYADWNFGGKVSAVDVRVQGATFVPGAPTELFDAGVLANGHATNFHNYAVSADGQRFLIPRPAWNATGEAVAPIAVVLNWAAGLQK